MELIEVSTTVYNVLLTVNNAVNWLKWDTQFELLCCCWVTVYHRHHKTFNWLSLCTWWQIEGLWRKKKERLLNILLPWQAKIIIEWAALIQGLFWFFNPHEYCCFFQSMSFASQGCCIIADLCCASYSFSTLSAAVLYLCIIHPVLWMRPCTVNPPRLIYSLLSIKHHLVTHFAIHMTKLC